MKHHWLFGTGPNKEVFFKVEIDKETDCGKCIHNKVCSFKMEDLCRNFEFGTSEHPGCAGCLHRFTRFDKDKTKLPCFTCPHFLDKDDIEKLMTLGIKGIENLCQTRSTKVKKEKKCPTLQPQ